MIHRIAVFILLFSSTIPAIAQNGLLDPANSADGLLITPDAFASAVLPLVEYRSAQGIRYRVAAIGEILEAFPSADTLTSIRQFTTYAMRSWTEPRPVALLLMGDVPLIPTYLHPPDPSYGTLIQDTAAIDDVYGDDLQDDDVLPELAVGRLPAADVEEVRIMIERTIAYEALPSHAGALDQLGFADWEEGDPFLSLVRSWHRTFDPPGERSWVLAADSANAETVADSLAHYVSRGIGTLLYAGHGSPDHWSRLHLLDAGDIPRLDLGTQPYFLYALACSQRFDLDGTPSIAENMLRLKRGGAAGAIVTTGLAFAMEQYQLGKNTRTFMEQDANACYGTSLLRAKRERTAGSGGSVLPLTLRTTLLGHPFLRNPHTVTGIRPLPTMDGIALDFVPFPNPLPRTSRTVQLRIRETPRGTASIIVSDLLGRIVTRQSAMLGSGTDVALSLPGLRPGNYLLTVHSGTAIAHRLLQVL